MIEVGEFTLTNNGDGTLNAEHFRSVSLDQIGRMVVTIDMTTKVMTEGQDGFVFLNKTTDYGWIRGGVIRPRDCQPIVANR